MYAGEIHQKGIQFAGSKPFPHDTGSLIGMTKKLFWDDAYIKEFDSTTSSINGNQVVLDQTAFNPRGGGLVGDIGTMNGMRVLDTLKGENDSIVHVLESAPGWQVGASAHGLLD